MCSLWGSLVWSCSSGRVAVCMLRWLSGFFCVLCSCRLVDEVYVATVVFIELGFVYCAHLGVALVGGGVVPMWFGAMGRRH